MARKATNPDNIKGKGFDQHPENINREGRPLKCPDIDTIIATVLNEKGADNLTRAENIFRAMCVKALTDVRAAELILDRSYGKLKVSAGLEIDFMKLNDMQLDQVIRKLISHD